MDFIFWKCHLLTLCLRKMIMLISVYELMTFIQYAWLYVGCQSWYLIYLEFVSDTVPLNVTLKKKSRRPRYNFKTLCIFQCVGRKKLNIKGMKYWFLRCKTCRSFFLFYFISFYFVIKSTNRTNQRKGKDEK